jgi:hypothetical protein
VGAPSLKGSPISIQLGLVEVDQFLVSIKGLLGFASFLAAIRPGASRTWGPCFGPLRRRLSVGRSVRVANLLGTGMLPFRDVEHNVIVRLARTSFVRHLAPCCIFFPVAGRE